MRQQQQLGSTLLFPTGMKETFTFFSFPFLSIIRNWTEDITANPAGSGSSLIPMGSNDTPKEISKTTNFILCFCNECISWYKSNFKYSWWAHFCDGNVSSTPVKSKLCFKRNRHEQKLQKRSHIRIVNMCLNLFWRQIISSDHPKWSDHHYIVKQYDATSTYSPWNTCD